METVHCHCGNVTLTFERLPAIVRDCDCPVCNRLGALWGDFGAGEVVIETTKTPTKTYIWGDGDYELHHCSICGCTTHYLPTAEASELGVGVNLRMLDRRRLEHIPITGQ
ncbi:MAG: aldehyde-activating protein [Acidobacteriota bacterium]